MLESTTHQGAGLLTLGATQGPRMMAVVSHGDEQAELPMLWRICAALVHFGYPVTVLDATICETEANPGLEQMLDGPHLRMAASQDAPAWTIVPAACGIQSISAMPAQRNLNLSRLGKMFPHDSVIILYGNAQWLVALLGDSDCSPLLAISAQKNALMTSYLALKRLLKKGRLAPTVVNLTGTQHTTAVSLGQCARNFLDYEVKPIYIKDPCDDSTVDGAVSLLALRLLESAVTLDTGQVAPFVEMGLQGGPQRFVSH